METAGEPTASDLEQAAQWVVRLRESGRPEDLPVFEEWLGSDVRKRLAYRQVSQTWAVMGQVSAVPEVLAGRRDALDEAGRAAWQRWSIRSAPRRYVAFAASAVVAVGVALTWFYLQRGVIETATGERRDLTLEDGSVVTLDAKSRVRVRYEEGQRLILLEQGQARFDVAKDPTRPFRVSAGDQTVIALGTQFTVERVAGDLLVSMLEGQVTVSGVDLTAQAPQRSRSVGSRVQHRMITLNAGEGVRVLPDGHAVVIPQIDVMRATAWQSGKLLFDNDSLATAVERVNRYSRLEITVDPAVADLRVSGAFKEGDANAFLEAIGSYFPVRVEHTSSSEIRLAARR